MKDPAMKTNMFRRTLCALACGAVLAGAAAGSAAAAVPGGGAAPAASTRGSSGPMSIKEVITNDTDQVWTYDSADSEHIGPGVHWGERPLQTLSPGQSETVTADSTEALGINLFVTYKIPDGEYVVADDVDAAIGSNGYNSAGVYPTVPDPDLGPTSKADPAYTTKASAGSGWHIDSTFTVSDAVSAR